MKDGDAALAIGDLIDGVLPHLAPLRGQRNQVVAQDDVVDDVLEETRHRQFRERDRCDRVEGLDQRRPLRIEFEEGEVVGHVYSARSSASSSVRLSICSIKSSWIAAPSRRTVGDSKRRRRGISRPRAS